MSQIAELREAKGLTQSQLARAIDVDISTIRNLERNRSGIQAIERVIQLCEILECEAKDLIKYVEAEETGEN
ncbi:helix-turn-helix domain-containing protein [Crocosphaera sp. Alani8]|uniref:helix-turn-helix domain-containing protein n=1 Tax=Crocosphaera sp. Alani8 TaxID=3038952 RepID=UPI00313BC4B3